MFFIQACRGGECPGRPAPGWWLLGGLPPALTLLFAPLRCYWIPWAPPSVHCCHRLSCSVSVSQCMGCAGPRAAHGSQVGQLSVRHHLLFSGLSLAVPLPSSRRTLTSPALLTLVCSFLLPTAVKELLSVSSLSLSLRTLPLFSSPLPLFSSHLHPIVAASLLHPCSVQAGSTEAPGRAVALTQPWAASIPLLSRVQSPNLEEPGHRGYAPKTCRHTSSPRGKP